MIINPYRYGNLLPPNTFLGGVSASITSPADYAASVVGLDVSNIDNFAITGGDVSFYIDSDFYSIADVNFPASPIKWIIDIDGLITSAAFASNRDSLKYVYMPSATVLNARLTLFDCAVISKINLQSVTTITNRQILVINNTLKKLDLRNLSAITNTFTAHGVLYQLGGLNRLHIGSLASFNSVDENRFLVFNVGRLPTFYLTKTGCKVYYNSALGVMDRKSYNRITTSPAVGDKLTINGLLYTCVATVTTDGEFTASGSGLVNAINSDTRTGTYSSVTASADGTHVGLEIDTAGIGGNAVTITLDGGNTGIYTLMSANFIGGYDIHKILMYLRDSRSCTMVEVSSPITVDAPTGLSYSNQTTNTVDLNFTPPAPNANGTDAYEVWVDDGTVFRKLFEYAEISSSGATLNLAEVVTDVGTIIGAKIKIRTIDGQMNFSDFSNEITVI